MKTISQNIKYLRQQAKMSQEAFGNLFGLTRGQVASYEKEENASEPVMETVLSIVDYFDVSLEAFLRHDLGSSYSLAHDKAGFEGLQEPQVGFESGKGVKIFVMDAKAAAGFPAEYQNAAFYQGLERFFCPLGQLGDGLYVCLQTQGDSMQPTLEDGDWLIVKLVQDFEDLKQGECYVVLTDEGVVVKRLARLEHGAKSVQLASDNALYQTMKLREDEVLQFWEIKVRMSFDFDRSPEGQEVDRLRSQMDFMMAELNDIKSKLGQ